MKAAIFTGPGQVEVGERPDPVIQKTTDAVVRVVLGCVCGSDLWYYRGESPHAVGSIGHEFIGVVEQAGADAALECVGTEQSIATAFAVARPGSTVGIVGVPHGQLPFAGTFFRNTGWRGGPAPARIYIPELLGDVLDGTISPGLVFDYETGLDQIADAYKAMDERRAIKSLVRIGAL